jgi:hypothetical protein
MTSGPLPDLRPYIVQFAREILGEPNTRLSTKSQLQFGTNGFIAVEISGVKRGQWFDHEEGIGVVHWKCSSSKAA